MYVLRPGGYHFIRFITLAAHGINTLQENAGIIVYIFNYSFIYIQLTFFSLIPYINDRFDKWLLLELKSGFLKDC